MLVTTSFSGSNRMDNVLKDHRCPIQGLLLALSGDFRFYNLNPQDGSLRLLPDRTNRATVIAMTTDLRNQIASLSAAEKAELLDAVWESLEAESPSLTEEQRALQEARPSHCAGRPFLL